ncbi:PspA-associated protein PspAA [Paraconexibacter algicola]|uniref:PspA-associated domain-containing protein n=1 Tax=Paraconexibacter algicola TaxID=2133960 RepID=A0A2T4UFG0_9ACTN|nr:hypothetical protein [Paraconexibacter algicola]PTL56462.1 hypothetical protein C7Y72_15995 [Paraconexibacter algicola]
MIVRVSNEGQYRIPDEHQGPLNELDNAVVAAVEADDEDRFHESFEELLQFIRTNGVAVGDDEIESSDVIVPPADLTLTEAAAEFTGDGLIPD